MNLNADIQNATNANTVLSRSFLSGPTFNQMSRAREQQLIRDPSSQSAEAGRNVKF